MFSKLFNTGAASSAGEGLAQELLSTGTQQRAPGRDDVQRLLLKVDQDVRPLKLGWLGRARLANAFKWRLREGGLAQDAVDELTQLVLTHLTRPALAGDQVPMKPNRAMRRRTAKKR
jgi:hypothetical protein